MSDLNEAPRYATVRNGKLVKLYVAKLGAIAFKKLAG